MRALQAADLIIEFANDLKHPVNNHELQVLLYLLNAIHIVELDSPLLPDEYFVKYDEIPMHKPVFFEYSEALDKKIKIPFVHMRLRRDLNENITFRDYSYTEFEEADEQFVWKYLQVLLTYSYEDLVNRVQREGQFAKLRNNAFYNVQLTKRYWSKHPFWNTDNKNTKGAEETE